MKTQVEAGKVGMKKKGEVQVGFKENQQDLLTN